ncbi:MAG TPA: hypothetical protein VEA80_19585 [Vitreimonas sp.]|uniref:hypothetical protein n=1 Tax=Vitreimonas sp. TaxID=3069702 RepID=UPI002D3441F6|nr:hypothetical protein [Vitreimonas sp.]HYD89693.1 hypothetical protein [Vitreimonas sp.]
MRSFILAAAAALALSACAAAGGGVTTRTSLLAADASTSLAAGERMTADFTTYPAREGADPVVVLTLRHADGRTMLFQQANHTANDLIAQRPGGALAQIMGLFGEEAPALYRATPAENSGAPFICGAEGAAALGYYEDASGVRIVGLKQEIQFETRPDGQTETVPYSPDQVCARLSFRRG